MHGLYVLLCCCVCMCTLQRVIRGLGAPRQPVSVPAPPLRGLALAPAELLVICGNEVAGVAVSMVTKEELLF